VDVAQVRHKKRADIFRSDVLEHLTICRNILVRVVRRRYCKGHSVCLSDRKRFNISKCVSSRMKGCCLCIDS